MKKTKNKYILMRTLSKEVPRHVGDFFEGFGKSLLNASNECSPDECDLARFDLDLGIEVKSRSFDHSFHIPASQLLAHVESAKGWPFSRYLYCLFGYRGRETRANKSGKRLSLLAKCRSSHEIRYILAQNPLRLHMLDISIIEAMHRTWGSIRNPFHSGFENVVQINHTDLAQLTPVDLDPSGAHEYLRTLGIKPENFEVVQDIALVPFKDGLFEYSLHISITKILPRVWVEELETTIFPFIPEPRFVFEETQRLTATSLAEEMVEA